jgi:CO/xanthine dehydrogenase Mo-binding subunit
MTDDRTKTNYRWVGKNTMRPDGVDKVTGRARYGDDLLMAGMLHAKILRSPHAHANILSIDVSKAAALAGVKAIITSADIPDHPLSKPPYPPVINDLHDISCNVMAREKVLYDGHAVAAVAATSAAIARQAVRLIEVEYEVLPHVLDPLEACGPDAPLLHNDQYTAGSDPEHDKPSNLAQVRIGQRGDIEKGFGQADIIIEREFSSQPVHQGYIEPLACIATSSEDGNVELWTSTQGHFIARGLIAGVLKMELSKLRVTASEIGGGFGGKTTIYGEPVAIRLSQLTGRPVRMVMTRSEVFRASGPASGTRTRIKMGVRNDGTITAAQANSWIQAGAFKGAPLTRATDTFFSAYTIANVQVSTYDVCVNRPKVAAYRAPGAPMAAFAVEGVINELAQRLGMDGVDLRLKNAVSEGCESLMGVKYKGPIGLVEVLQKVKSHEHYSAPLKPHQGRGLALGYWMHGGGLSSASVSVLDDGTISLATGSPDIGGSRSSMRVMAAEELGIDIDLINTVIADTASIAYSYQTAGSRTTYATGMAVINATRMVIDKLRAVAAKKWQVPVDEVSWEAGLARPVKSTADDIKPLNLKELAKMAPGMVGPIAGHSEINAAGQGAAFSAQLVDVEIDPQTGFVSPIRYTAFQDVGRAISPDYVEGQMQGAAVQGVGWALNEEYIYSDKGLLQNAGFLDYRMPVASDVPMIDTVMIEVPNPNHPYGVRGVGEPPLISAPAAVANAVENAIGKTMSHLPLSPPKVLKAIEQV